ncbi:hypothetical protein L9F63_024442, partial [Diploptera punctata]
ESSVYTYHLNETNFLLKPFSLREDKRVQLPAFIKHTVYTIIQLLELAEALVRCKVGTLLWYILCSGIHVCAVLAGVCGRLHFNAISLMNTLRSFSTFRMSN